MTSPSLLIVGERKRRGRPFGTKVAEPGAPMSAWVPVSLYDQAAQIATKDDTSLSKLVCEGLKLAIAARASRN